MNNQSNLWDSEYNKDFNKWHKETIKLPNILKNKRVLEIGVGNGKTLKAIMKQKPKSLTAVDFSKVAIDKLSKLYPSVRFVCSDIFALDTKEKFDIIVCYYVLDNMLDKDRIKAVKIIHSLLSPKGKLIFQDFAVGDFRQSERYNEIEKGTIQKQNGIICHFFSIDELTKLFKDFSSSKFTKSYFQPIIKRPEIKRKIVSGIVIK